LRRNGGSAITLITTFNLSLENENSENLKWVCEALAMRDRLITVLKFSLEKKRKSAMPGNPILVPLKRLNMRWVWEALALARSHWINCHVIALLTMFNVSLEKPPRNAISPYPAYLLP
jgi:hypothetical protein